MELLYPHEHLNCYNYEKGDRPAIDPIYLNTEDRYNIDILENKIIILRSGLQNQNKCRTLRKICTGTTAAGKGRW